MHEMSIVQDLISQCEAHMANSVGTLKKVVIKVGRLSGVEAHYLIAAFDAFKELGVCANADLEVISGEVVVRCKACGKKSVLAQNYFVCEECGSGEVEMVEGDELVLMRLELV